VAPLFEHESFVRDLKEHRLWSLEWVSDNGVEGPFTYAVLRKREGGGYDQYGEFETATQAFEARRQLVAERGDPKFFLRCKRVPQNVEVVGPDHPESREDLDRWRDALSTGDEGLIPDTELPAFRSWAASTIESRPEYRRSSSGGARLHGEIPF
jgi:hypothetical protein